MDTQTLILIATLAIVSALSLLFVADREDVGIRAARTFLQSALSFTLTAAVTPMLELDVITVVILPSVTAAATVIHGALQPAETPAK